MSLLDGFTPTYAFQLRIERSDRTILDTTIVAKATADEIAKAKKNVRRLLDEYTPTVRATTPAPTTPPETGTPALPEPENQVPAGPMASPEPEAQPSEAAPPRIKSQMDPEGCSGCTAGNAGTPSALS